MKRHWTSRDFVITARRDEREPNGEGYYREAGYCQVCYADMQRFGPAAPLSHYHSHNAARRLGLWGT